MQRPEGYETTIKAGEIIFDNGTHTGALPGKLIRRSNEKESKSSEKIKNKLKMIYAPKSIEACAEY